MKPEVLRKRLFEFPFCGKPPCLVQCIFGLVCWVEWCCQVLKGVRINFRPTTKLGMGLWTVVAGTLAWRKRPGLEGVADCFFCRRNGRPPKAAVRPVGESIVRILGHITLRWRRRKGFWVDARPTTNLKVGDGAVIWRPTVWAEFSRLDGADDDFFVNGNAGVEGASVRPRRQAVCRLFRFHVSGFHWNSICLALVAGRTEMGTKLLQNFEAGLFDINAQVL